MDIKWDYIFKDLDKIPETVIAATLVYLLILLYTRIFGLKSFSKMTGFDFLNTLAIGSLVGMSISTASPAPLLGAFTIGLLYFFNYVITVSRFKSSAVERLVENSPIYLLKDGNVLHDNLKKTKITENELRGKLREANAFRLSHVRAVILETTGDISVMHTTEDLEIEDYIMEGIDD